MKLINVFFLSMAIMILGSCANQQAKADPKAEMAEEQALWDEVMSFHDQGMSEMKDIAALKKYLSGNQDKLTDDNSKKIAEMAIAKLDEAEKGMWDWMHDLVKLEDLQKDKTHAEIMAYLTTQKEVVSNVKEQIKASVASGKQVRTLIKEEEQK
ncbi:MAG: hypothetical protein KDC85_02800 [Saprospiraceae bacterium]|nr:hypothetical protein [Saprospiraceae bacterium]MCB9324186.1 hypothetical protein [Lewinellaceae bacterium]